MTEKHLISIPVSIGELFDKISILEIKLERMDDEEKLKNIREELKLLKEISIKFDIPDELYQRLKVVNEEMWDAEDERRHHEKLKLFDDKFIQLGRLDHFKNDARAVVKKEINILLNSHIIEEKSYKSENGKFDYEM